MWLSNLAATQAEAREAVPELPLQAPLLNDFPDVYFPFALHELNLNEPILVLQATLPVTG